MFIVNGDGTYTVRFNMHGGWQYVTVDSQMPTDQYGRLVFDGMGQYASDSSKTLWAALAEKAFVQLNETGWERPGMSGSGVNSYVAISGGYIYAALVEITGQSAV